MKKLLPFFSIVALLIFQACEGPEGPAGPVGPQGPQGTQGAQGEDGFNFVGTTYEAEITFTEEEGWGGLFDFPEELVESDVVLLYRLTGVDGDLAIWRQLPQTIFFEEGVLMYNFDFSVLDFSVFLDGPIDYTILGPEWTDNQIFRIVVVPSDFPDGRIDYSDYQAVTEWLDIKETDFVRLSPRITK